jgi:endonuclease YncB( thermonuclease family)
VPQQCVLAGVSRATVYVQHKPKLVDESDLLLSRLIDEAYRQYAKEQSEADRHRYEFAETEAKAKKAGLWSEKDPVPPWEWRHLPK